LIRTKALKAVSGGVAKLDHSDLTDDEIDLFQKLQHNKNALERFVCGLDRERFTFL